MKTTQAVILAVAGLFIAVGLLLFLYQPQKEAYVSITFDDGYASQYDAAKILESYGYKGTFYIATDFVGNKYDNISVISWEQVKDLQARGHEIGGHGASHLNASNVSAELYENDLKEGKEELGENNISVENFAYPHGDNSKKDIVLKYFETARTTKPCINKISDNEICGLTLVHKNEEYKALTIYLGELKLKGGWLVVAIHSISENPRQDVDVTNEEFGWILKQISLSGAKVMTIKDIKELNKV
jgi:peptidoglycan/xylan/chitin deacetylase (PgdA/CDA1 family)